MKKLRYSLLGLLVVMAVIFIGFSEGQQSDVCAADATVLGDLTGDSNVTADDRNAIMDYLVGKSNETTTSYLSQADVNGDTTDTTTLKLDVKDLVRYERYLAIEEAKTTASSGILEGSGTNQDPYEISTIEDLYIYAAQSSYFNNSSKVLYTQLNNDICINMGTGDTTAWDHTEQLLAQWTPIGNGTTTFAESFTGNDYTISGLYLQSDSQKSGLGFFGNANNGNASISNLRIENSYIEGTTTGEAWLGGVVGRLGGSMANVYCDADVVSKGHYVGGLVGLCSIANAKNITKCWFNGTVSNNAGLGVGGLIGRLHEGTKTIADCLFTGSVIHTGTSDSRRVGGICGYIQNGTITIERCLSAGNVKAATASTVGSVVGSMAGGTTTFISTYTTDDITNTKGNAWTTTDAFDGVGSGSASYKATDSENPIIVLGREHMLGYTGYRLTTALGYDSTGAWVAKENGVPELKTLTTDEQTNLAYENCLTYHPAKVDWYYGFGKTTPFSISSAEDMYGLSMLSEVSTDATEFQDQVFELKTNIIMNETDIDTVASWGTTAPTYQWTPIGHTIPFAGTFNGNGYTISGLYVKSDEQYLGFFGQTSVGDIRDFKIMDSYFESTKPTGSGNAGKAYIGSVAGFASDNNFTKIYSNAKVVELAPEYGGLIGCYAGSGESTIAQCWFDGIIEGRQGNGGGIVGRIFAGTKTLRDCLNTGNLTRETNAANGTELGGLCGGVGSSASATFERCLDTGSIKITESTSLKDSFAGNKTSGSFTNSYSMNKVMRISGTLVNDVTCSATIKTETELTGETGKALLEEAGFDFTTTPVWEVTDKTPILSGFSSGVVE